MQILNTGYQRSGKNSRVEVSGSTLVRNRFEVEWTTGDLDTVSFESLGSDGNHYDEGIENIRMLSYAVDGDWDANQNPYDSPPGLFPRDDLPDLRLTVNTNDDTSWFLYYARIRSARNTTAVRDKVGFNFSGKNQGEFVAPTGSV